MIFTVPLNKEITHIDIKMSRSSSPLSALHVRSEQSLHFTGTLPDELYPFVYTGKSKGHRLWHGNRLKHSGIETKGDANDVDGLIFESTDVRMLLVQKSFIEKYLRELYGEGMLSRYYRFNTYELKDEDLDSFLDIHHDILNEKEISEDKTGALLLKILQNPVGNNSALDKGYLLIQRAVILMKQHLRDPLKIKELTDKLDVCDRTLELAFKKYLGISPKAYYKRLLLLHIESDLRERNSCAVSHVIQEYQIYNLSQFGASFKDYFNKTPSEVLKLKKEDNPFGWNERVFSEFKEVC